MQNFIRDTLLATQTLLAAMREDAQLIAQVEKAALICIGALECGEKILTAGNGGSAADAQHIAAELVSRFNYDRPGLASVALTTDTSALTAIGNDYGYEKLFSRQIEALGREGDVLIALSTSGNSLNILAGIEMAKARGLKVIGLTGQGGGKMNGMCDVLIRVPSGHTPRVQEGHIVIAHILCQLIEDTMFKGH